MTTSLTRRQVLRSAGVCLTLPLLDAFLTRESRASDPSTPRRLVFMCTSLGLHAPSLFPTKAGGDYETTPYLKHLEKHREHFTLFNGISHPDQAGADGHSSEVSWLTSAKHPGLGGFRNTISVDQLVAERVGFETRFPSIQLGTNNTCQSYTRSGVMIHAESRPSKMFEKLFLEGTPQEKEKQMRRIQDGRSILDTLQQEAQQFATRVGSGDRAKLDEYYTSVREMEQRLAKAEEWERKKKPEVEAKSPTDIANESDLIGRMRLLFELIPLALQTDSTRVITVLIQGRNDVPPVPGVTIDHHNLSHHGQNEEKIKQLQLIEEAEMEAFGNFLTAMREKQEGGKSLLDHSTILFGSNLGNANSHDTKNLPLILAGGGFKHGRYIEYDKEKNVPLSNLFVQMLQNAGHEIHQFGTSTSQSLPDFGQG